MAKRRASSILSVAGRIGVPVAAVLRGGAGAVRAFVGRGMRGGMV